MAVQRSAIPADMGIRVSRQWSGPCLCFLAAGPCVDRLIGSDLRSDCSRMQSDDAGSVGSGELAVTQRFLFLFYHQASCSQVEGKPEQNKAQTGQTSLIQHTLKVPDQSKLSRLEPAQRSPQLSALTTASTHFGK